MALLQATLESTGDAILVADSTGRAMQLNRRLTETWGHIEGRGGELFNLEQLRRSPEWSKKDDQP